MDIDKLKEFFESEEGKIYIELQKKVNSRKFDKELRFEDSILNYITLLDTEEDVSVLAEKFLVWEDNIIEINPNLWVDANSNIFNRMVKIFVCLGIKYQLYDGYLGVAYLYRGYVLKIYQGQGCLYRLKKDGVIIF